MCPAPCAAPAHSAPGTPTALPAAPDTDSQHRGAAATTTTTAHPAYPLSPSPAWFRSSAPPRRHDPGATKHNGLWRCFSSLPDFRSLRSRLHKGQSLDKGADALRHRRLYELPVERIRAARKEEDKDLAEREGRITHVSTTENFPRAMELFYDALNQQRSRDAQLKALRDKHEKGCRKAPTQLFEAEMLDTTQRLHYKSSSQKEEVRRACDARWYGKPPPRQCLSEEEMGELNAKQQRALEKRRRDKAILCQKYSPPRPGKRLNSDGIKEVVCRLTAPKA